MKKRIALLALLGLALCSCKERKAILPTVSGKAGEVMVVIEKADWDGNLGEDVRMLLADEYPYLPAQEPMYSLVNVAPGGFADIFKVHRNIVFFDIDPFYKESSIVVKKDIWAAPQCVIQIAAKSSESADSLVCVNGDLIISVIEQAERDRVITATMKYENREVFEKVSAVFGGSLHCPSGYKVRKVTDDFAWIADDKNATTQGVFVYSYPASGNDDFEYDKIIAVHNEVLRANVPGPKDGSYMTTSTYWKPDMKFLRYQGRAFAEVHGMWEVEGDFMGGPFVLHAFYAPDGKNIIVQEAWLYAPHDNKRQLFRQTEALLYSWEWNKVLESEK